MVTVRGVAVLGKSLTTSPGEVRHLRRWYAERGKSPFDLASPWMNYRAIAFLESEVTPVARVFEYGSGGSTLWFASRAGSVLSIEHNPEWAELVAGALEGVDNATLVQVPVVDGDYSAYVAKVLEEQDGSFDVVVVDGRHRVACVRNAASKVAPGGVLLLDDSERTYYQGAFEALADWPHITFRGIKAGGVGLVSTTVWRAPQG